MKAKCFVTALLWGILIILFPAVSGALSAILKLDTVEALFLQGAVMLLDVALHKKEPQVNS